MRNCAELKKKEAATEKCAREEVGNIAVKLAEVIFECRPKNKRLSFASLLLVFTTLNAFGPDVHMSFEPPFASGASLLAAQIVHKT